MMNERFRMLVKRDDYRYIARCEHGTIHLVWGITSFHLQPELFFRVARLLQRAHTSSDQDHLCDEHICLIRKKAKFELVMGSAGLHLDPTELRLLINMTARAVQRLTTSTPGDSASSPAHVSKKSSDTMTAHGTPFSLN